ncbi:MAG: class I SAM-dependent methyltransferase [Dokdonella sp.]|nr:class I SAM-dependent methyltransferase [Dokdonella sp.]
MSPTSLDSTQRFSDRVADYVRYRPDYPAALIDWLSDAHGLVPSWTVADVGAGTGISSRMFLDAGNTVFAVEPNAPMRAAAERWLGGNPRFHAVDGSAEATTLAAGSVDLVTARAGVSLVRRRRGAARMGAHPQAARSRRAVFWNSRLLAGSAFLEGYERLLLDYGTDYVSVAERYADEAAMRRWFGEGYRGAATFPHRQLLDFDALRGRLLSSSYAPREGDPRHAPMLAALRTLFDATAREGLVGFDYETRIYVGTLPAPA